MARPRSTILVVVTVFLWVLVGAVAATLHGLLVWRALLRLDGIGANDASKRMVRGVPFRVSMWALPLILAARAGLPACMGLGLGSVVAHWIVGYRTLARTRQVEAQTGRS